MNGKAVFQNRISRAAALKTAGFVLLMALCVLLVYYWRVFYYLDARGVSALPLTAGVCGIAAGLYAAALLCVRLCRGFAPRAALVVFGCGLLFVFANPPMQVPDEGQHYLRAYRISEGVFDFDASRAYPADVDRLMEAFPGAWVNGHTSAGTRTNSEGAQEIYDTSGYALKQYGESGEVSGIADGFAAYFSGAAAKAHTAEPWSFVLLPYLAAAPAMALARLFGFAALGCLYAGRIANLAVYALLCWAALRRCQKYRAVFLTVMLLPLSLYMAASLNYDAILLGCCYFLATYFFDREIDGKGLAAFAAVFLLTNAIKPWINLLWLAALCFIPKSGWKAKCRRWQLATGCAAAAVLLSRGIDWYGAAFRMNYGVIGRQMEAADMLGQLKFVLANPLRYIAVLAGTLYENNLYLGQMGVFGALDLPIGFLNLCSPLVLALGCVLAVPRADTVRLGRAAGIGAYGIVYAAGALTAMYITWTPVGMVRIIGFQARYLLPVFLLGGAALSGLLSRLLVPAGGAEKRENLALGVCGCFAVLGALLLWQHYFIGPVYTI